MRCIVIGLPTFGDNRCRSDGTVIHPLGKFALDGRKSPLFVGCRSRNGFGVVYVGCICMIISTGKSGSSIVILVMIVVAAIVVDDGST